MDDTRYAVLIGETDLDAPVMPSSSTPLRYEMAYSLADGATVPHVRDTPVVDTLVEKGIVERWMQLLTDDYIKRKYDESTSHGLLSACLIDEVAEKGVNYDALYFNVIEPHSCSVQSRVSSALSQCPYWRAYHRMDAETSKIAIHMYYPNPSCTACSII